MRRSALPPETRLRQNDSHVIYEIQEQIGQGGSAVIYRAVKYDRQRQSKVILKEIYPASDRGGFIRLPDGSLVPGFMDLEGRAVPAEEDSYFYDNGWEVLGRLREQRSAGKVSERTGELLQWLYSYRQKHPSFKRDRRDDGEDP